MVVTGWDCDAYGPEGEAVGALCFFADSGRRDCATHDECAARMADERRRVYRAINELAAAGDPTMAHLADEFPTPDGLLGDDSTEPQP